MRYVSITFTCHFPREWHVSFLKVRYSPTRVGMCDVSANIGDGQSTALVRITHGLALLIAHCFAD